MIVEWLFFIVINQMITLTLVKFVFNKGTAKNTAASKQDAVSWNAAIDSMSTMESRIEQLVARDVKQQAQVWQLQDLNRELQEKTMRLTKELLVSVKSDDPPAIFGQEDDPDEDTR